MKLNELVVKIKEANPESFEKVPNGVIAKVLRGALPFIKQSIKDGGEETVAVPLLGRFRSKEVAIERNGESIKAQRTLFVPAPERAKGDSTEE